MLQQEWGHAQQKSALSIWKDHLYNHVMRAFAKMGMLWAGETSCGSPVSTPQADLGYIWTDVSIAVFWVCFVFVDLLADSIDPDSGCFKFPPSVPIFAQYDFRRSEALWHTSRNGSHHGSRTYHQVDLFNGVLRLLFSGGLMILSSNIESQLQIPADCSDSSSFCTSGMQAASYPGRARSQTPDYHRRYSKNSCGHVLNGEKTSKTRVFRRGQQITEVWNRMHVACFFHPFKGLWPKLRSSHLYSMNEVSLSFVFRFVVDV